jgi:anti-sigma B factor antagonist
MKFKTKKMESTSVVFIDGDIDALTSGEVTEYLNECIMQGEAKLIVDLNRVDFMSSAGLRVILGAVKKCRSNNGDLVLVAPQPGVARVLKMSGFENILNCFESIDLAVNKLNELS